MRTINCQGSLKLNSSTEQAYMLKNPSGSNMRTKGGNFQLWNIEDEAWHTVFVMGALTLEQIALGGADVSDADTATSCVL